MRLTWFSLGFLQLIMGLFFHRALLDFLSVLQLPAYRLVASGYYFLTFPKAFGDFPMRVIAYPNLYRRHFHVVSFHNENYFNRLLLLLLFDFRRRRITLERVGICGRAGCAMSRIGLRLGNARFLASLRIIVLW